MATVKVTPEPNLYGDGNPSSVVLSNAQTGNGDSQNVAQRIAPSGFGAALIIASTAGATPTVTVNILGSVDGVNYYNVGYALVSAPESPIVSPITITTTVTTTYIIRPGIWKYLKLNYSANTNVTLTATLYV